MTTGVARLDDLLGGGFPAGSAILLYGPPFCGKAQLAVQAVVQGIRAGTPVTILLHTVAEAAMRKRLVELEPGATAAERAGLLTYADFFTSSVENGPAPDVLALLDGQEKPLVVVESASDMLVEQGSAAAFHTLRAILGRTRGRGGVALIALEAGMHADAEVQMAKHLCTGMLEFRRKGEAHILRVEGLETRYRTPGWVEYDFTPKSFKVTGSFAAKAIK